MLDFQRDARACAECALVDALVEEKYNTRGRDATSRADAGLPRRRMGSDRRRHSERDCRGLSQPARRRRVSAVAIMFHGRL
jgi:hypothetical protein